MYVIHLHIYDIYFLFLRTIFTLFSFSLDQLYVVVFHLEFKATINRLLIVAKLIINYSDNQFNSLIPASYM